MRRSIIPFMALIGLAIGGCSAGRSGSIPGDNSSLSAVHAAPMNTKGPIITPTYLDATQAREEYFEVHGRTKLNHQSWQSWSNCSEDVHIAFATYNREGSQYGVTVSGSTYTGYGTCKYTAKNPQGRKGSITISYDTRTE